MILGLDMGSSATKAVLLEDSLRPVEFLEQANRGDPAEAYRVVVNRIFEGRGGLSLRLGITGAGRDFIAAPGEVYLANEVISLALGVAHFHPEARSVIEIGAQTSRWVLVDRAGGASAEPEILDFSLNDVCAAGSGAFIEQQAARLKLTIEEFSRLAASAKKGAPIAGRCSVFAKTDMIHLQQKGTPLEEIAYGLCLALARNFLATVLRGREALSPVVLAGGGFRNAGLVHAFREVLGLGQGEWRLAKPPHQLGSFGAAVGAANAGRVIEVPGADFLFQLLKPRTSHRRVQRMPLGALDVRHAEEPSPGPGEAVRGYLGVDIGSVSTNLVLVDPDGRVRAGVYLPTRGRPIEVLREGFRLLRDKCPGGVELLGIGTTGSGRHLAGTILQADVVHNEITCQLRSAVKYFPDVDTVFEIGGQDSKFISARDGKIVDFTMNKICAAGTGSFLEEQAEILGIRIEDEFSTLAAASGSPSDLGSRCTVFMESELADSLARGVPVSDISAGLAFSIARNYLEKVVAGRPVGTSIVFQGGVASNPSVVRAFTIETGREIRVHPFNRISGAIGAAVMAREKVGRTGKISPDATAVGRRLGQEYTVASFTCSHCSNRCQVNRVAFEDEIAFFGDTCERYTARRGRTARIDPGTNPLPDLFKERDDLVEGFIRNPPNPAARIGLPRASVLYEFLPFWAAFFNRLGAEVLVSPPSNHEILEIGLRRLSAETCLPIKIGFGHIEWFRDKTVDGVFFPSVIDLHQNPAESVSLCPYSESFPFMARAASGLRILAPSVCFNGNPEEFLRSVSSLREILNRTEDEMREAYEAAAAAQKEFQDALRGKGRKALDFEKGDGSPAWAILGRPYTLHDPFLNLNLGRHLAKLGVLALPIDFLPLEGTKGVDWPGAPPWRYNQQVIQALLWTSERSGIQPVVLTNFGCGLDAFNLRHVSKIVSDRPHLVLEFDEHRAEAGLITRLEAFRDEVGEARTGSRRPAPLKRPPRSSPESYEAYRTRRLVLPYFADHAYAFSGAFRGVGVEAEVLPRPDADTVSLGEQYATGKECHAYSIIAGDFVKFARSERRGGEVFYFPGTKDSCVLAQYDKGLNYLAEDLGIDDLEAIAPTADFLPQVLTMKGMKLLWQGLVAIDLLVRASCSIRPYEIRKGVTDRIHLESLADIESGLSSGGLGPALKRCAERLKSVEVRRVRRPVVGIAGDVYTRINPVANHDLFLKLEELGCEVRPSSFFVDDVDFDLARSIRKKIVGRKYGTSTVMALLYLRKELEKVKIRKSLERAGPIARDPTFNEVVRFVTPYFGLENNQTLLLNIAKMVEFVEEGVDGVINAICFNCMLGTVSAAIAAKIRKDYDEIPIPTFIYAGSERGAERTRLEAFAYQVRQYAKRKKRHRPAGTTAGKEG
jgi:predicted CoA-substrate-specific enzyme activase